MIIREALPDEVPLLAQIWHQGWREAHANIVPEALARTRTLQSFHDRLSAALPDTRVIGPPGRPIGLCILKGEELYQLYVAAEARGAGAAAALIGDAEKRLAAIGVKTAWLACAIGNARAARFYEKSGWRRAGTVVENLETSDGPFALEVWRYERDLFAR